MTRNRFGVRQVACRAGMLAFFLIASTQIAAQTGAPIKIGLDGPFTGGSSPAGISIRSGTRLAVEEINRNGGVLGRPLLLVERDDESKNELGIQIAQEFIDKEKVAAVVGFANSGVVLAASRFYQDAQIPMIVSAATASIITHQFDSETDNYVFRVSMADFIQAHLIAEEAVTRRGLKKVAILADSTNYGQLGREDLEKALAAKGITPVAEEKFNIGDVDMTAQLLKAKQAGADSILTYGIGRELAQIANGMTKIDWKVPMIGSWTLSYSTFIDAAGPPGEGAIMPQSFIQVPSTPKRKAFIESYLKQFSPKFDRIEVPSQAAQAYDATLLLAAAIRQAGSLDGPKIRAALEDLRDPVEGVVMTYGRPYNKADHEAFTANIAVIGMVKGERVVYAYDADLRDAGKSKTKNPDANKF